MFLFFTYVQFRSRWQVKSLPKLQFLRIFVNMAGSYLSGFHLPKKFPLFASLKGL